ncbi:MAG: hypothetical protein FWB91_08275 [Defluviitaleaceae bacterium]|nr:hypothetical protein [Defluviitaleaceae bacterium]
MCKKIVLLIMLLLASGLTANTRENALEVTEEFLSEFLTIFQTYRGWRDLETGELHALCRQTWRWVETEDMPLVFMGGRREPHVLGDDWGFQFTIEPYGSVYDRDGNSIIYAPFIFGRADANRYVITTAESFALYDLDGDGIPEIRMQWVSWYGSYFGRGSTTWFRLINGEFINIGWIFPEPIFFTDPDGNIIALINDEKYGIYGYYYFRFTDDGMERVPMDLGFDIADIIWGSDKLRQWHEHHYRLHSDLSPYFTVFMLGTHLTRIPRLTELERELTNSIRQNLKINEMLPDGDIVPCGREATEEFLSQFTTLFQGILSWRDLETGGFYARHPETWQWIETDGTSLVYFGGTRFEHCCGSDFIFDGKSFFDRDGKLIIDASFIGSSFEYVGGRRTSVAKSFYLYDFDVDGIPEIIIEFFYWTESGFGFFADYKRIYKFIDGAFEEVGRVLVGGTTFFHDPDGNVILLYNIGYFGAYGYYYLNFVDGGMELVRIISPIAEDWPLSFQSWDAHHWSFRNNESTTYTMYGCGTHLTRIPRLTELERELTEILRGQHIKV